jgi:hypothetical protein
MKRKQHFGWMAWALLAVAIAGALSKMANAGTSATDRFAITPEHVSRVLNSAGIAAKTEEVQFLSTVNSAGQNPQLTVVNVSTWRDGNLKALLRCQNIRECLPFYVVLRDKKAPIQTSSFYNVLHESFVSQKKINGKSAEKPLVVGGQHAMLVINTRNSRITLPVICLESGRKGETIRLASPDKKQKYEGEVVQAGVLQGKF